jgi:hypothetical protein
VGTIPLAELTGESSDVALPLQPGVDPLWLVPSEVSKFTVSAQATLPIDLDLQYNAGNPQLGGISSGNNATATESASQVSPGVWVAFAGEKGPYPGPAPAGSMDISASAIGQLFDPAVTSDTGDFWQEGVDPALDPAAAASIGARGLNPIAPAAASAKSGSNSTPAVTGPPVDLPPGASTTINVTITPSAAKGTVVRGHLYIDTLNTFLDGADEIVDLPYAYTVS